MIIDEYFNSLEYERDFAREIRIRSNVIASEDLNSLDCARERSHGIFIYLLESGRERSPGRCESLEYGSL